MKIGFVSLGCPKNQVDSEVMLGLIRKKGLEITVSPSEAEIIVVNTCSFIDSAKEEAVNTILRMAAYKETGMCKKLIVAGCMVQQYGSELLKELPEIDALISLDEFEKIADYCSDVEVKTVALPVKPSSALADHRFDRILTTPSYMAYLKISDGCNHKCSFCVIPDIRGKFRSRTVESLVVEAQNLVASGVRELVLVAQDSTFYGKDLTGNLMLPRLLRELAKIKDLIWIRVMYFYPGAVTDELIAVMAEEEKICSYIDIPLQHVSERILREMKRPGDRNSYEHLIGKIRKNIPGVSIRSSFIVGFPGEREKEFNELLEFCQKVKFDNLGVFTYSPQQGTASAEMKNQIDVDAMERRKLQLMEQQSVISMEKNKELIGKKITILCEGLSHESELLLQGRTEGQAPDIDGRVLITDGYAEPGEFAVVEVEEAFPYDVAGKIIEKIK